MRKLVQKLRTWGSNMLLETKYKNLLPTEHNNNLVCNPFTQGLKIQKVVSESCYSCIQVKNLTYTLLLPGVIKTLSKFLLPMQQAIWWRVPWCCVWLDMTYNVERAIKPIICPSIWTGISTFPIRIVLSHTFTIADANMHSFSSFWDSIDRK